MNNGQRKSDEKDPREDTVRTPVSKVQVDFDPTPIPTETEKSGKIGSGGWSKDELKNPTVQQAAKAQAKAAPDDTRPMPAGGASMTMPPAAGPPPLPPKQAPVQRLPAPPANIMSPADRTAAAMSPQGQAKPVKTPAATMARGVTEAPPDAETIRSANSPGAIPPEEIDSLQKGYAAKPKPFTPGLEATNPAITIPIAPAVEAAAPAVLANRREQNIEQDAGVLAEQNQKLRDEITGLEEALRYRAEERDIALRERDTALRQVVERDRQLAESQGEAKQLRQDLIDNGVIKEDYEATKKTNSDLKEENKSLRKVANGTNSQATAEVTKLHKEVRQCEDRIHGLVEQNRADLEARQKAEEKAKQLEQKVADLQKLTPQQLAGELAEGVRQGKKKVEDAKVPLNGTRFPASDPKEAIQSFLLLFELCLKALFAERQARTKAESDLAIAVGENTGLSDSHERLESERARLIDELGNANARANLAETDLATATRQLQEKSNLVDTLDNKIIDLNGDNARLEGEKVVQAERIAQFETADAEKARIIGEQDATIQQRNAQVAELDETVKSLSDELGNTQAELQNIMENVEPNRNEIARMVKEGAEILDLLKSFVGDEKYDSLVIMREFVDGNGELQKQVDIFATIKQIATVISAKYKKYKQLLNKLKFAESRLEEESKPSVPAKEQQVFVEPEEATNHLSSAATPPTPEPDVTGDDELARLKAEIEKLKGELFDLSDAQALRDKIVSLTAELEVAKGEIEWARKANDRDNIRKAFRKQCAILGLTERQNRIWMDIADAMASAPDKQVEELDLAVRAFMEEYPTATARADKAEQAKAQAEAERDAANQRAETVGQQLADLRQQLVVVPVVAEPSVAGEQPAADVATDQQLADLRQQLADAIAESTRHLEQASEVEKQALEYRDELEEEHNKAAKEINGKFEAVDQTLANAEIVLAAANQQVPALIDERDGLANNLQTTFDAFVTAEKDARDVGTQLSQTTKELEQAAEKLATAEAKVAELDEKVKAVEAQAETDEADFQQELIEAKTELGTANEARVLAEQNAEQAALRNGQLTAQVTERDATISQLTADNTAANEAKATIEQKAAGLESDLQGTRTALETATQQFNQAQGEADRLNQELDEVKAANEEFAAELAAAYEREKEMAHTVKSVQAAAAASSNNSASASGAAPTKQPPAPPAAPTAEEVAKLQAERDKAQAEYKGLVEQWNGLVKDYEGMTTKRDQLKEKADKLEAERQNVCQASKDNDERAMAAERKVEQMEEEKKNLRQQLDDARRQQKKSPAKKGGDDGDGAPAPVVVHNEQPPRRGRWMWPILAIILLALVGGAGIWLFQRSGVEIYRDGVVKGTEVLKDGITKGKECCEGKNCVCPPAQPTSAPAEPTPEPTGKPRVSKPAPQPAGTGCKGCASIQDMNDCASGNTAACERVKNGK